MSIGKVTVSQQDRTSRLPRMPRGRKPFSIDGHDVRGGTKAMFEMPIARLMSGTPVALPTVVLHGRRPGPTMWVSGAIHGDEILGVEIIRRVLAKLDAKTLIGTVVAVPIVNVHGFNTGDRYLPDRRDLNRSFPGAKRGSLASRVADLMMTRVISRCDFGIDLHTGSDGRINLPQIRGDLDNEDVRVMAKAFAAPLTLHAKLRDGSLRQAAGDMGVDVLLFEGGEANRFDRHAIRVGTNGVLRVLQHRGMIEDAPPPKTATQLSRSSRWMRAGQSGICHLDVELGQQVHKGEALADVHDPFGKRLGRVKSRVNGVVIGHSQRPLVNRGDAVVHVAAINGDH